MVGSSVWSTPLPVMIVMRVASHNTIDVPSPV
jgi:hypothetical protein